MTAAGPARRVLALSAPAAQVMAAAPRCGTTRLVCVDGPSGSGKTTLAGRLSGRLGGAPVLPMEELYPGWDGLAAAVVLLLDQVVTPLAAGRPARYRRWDWAAEGWGAERDLGVPPVLLVEGVGAGARLVAAHAVLLVWVTAPRTERFRRGLARDGETYRPHWTRWARQEEAHFAAEGTAAQADLRVDGDPSVRHDPATEVVLLD